MAEVNECGDKVNRVVSACRETEAECVVSRRESVVSRCKSVVSRRKSVVSRRCVGVYVSVMSGKG